ncbi:MAG: aspartate kinase [Ferruginibacter sp.]
MDVYKFGGASLNSNTRIKNTGEIIKNAAGTKLLIIVSAIGKTTNKLETVVSAFTDGRQEEALTIFEEIKKDHLEILKSLTNKQWSKGEIRLKEFFTEIEWLLHDKPVRSYDYYYDQVVCIGELLSSCILSCYLEEENNNNSWLDVRDIIRTDNNFRDAAIDWEFTNGKINESIVPLFDKSDILITQGFIGSTDENESTTLGREGSDFTAAIFANLLNARSVTIWKDVEAVMNADPKQFDDAVNIYALNYLEVIEMAYYGAQVIHPKTIKPLQNKNIPLYVKSFLQPSLPGTVINNENPRNIPPVIVLKQNQVLITFSSKDFSFVEDKPVEQLQEIFHKTKIKSNLSQHTAISLLCCFDAHEEKIGQLAGEASLIFDVSIEKDLTLLTVRHYNKEIINRLTNEKKIVLEQRTLETAQILMK